jgi:hypothetical protein
VALRLGKVKAAATPASPFRGAVRGVHIALFIAIHSDIFLSELGAAFGHPAAHLFGDIRKVAPRRAGSAHRRDSGGTLPTELRSPASNR